ANTRVWENVREVPVVDDETGKTELVTVRNQVYEKADNLCYDISTTDTPEWLPTVEEITKATDAGLAYQAKQGGYQVSFTGDLTAPWSIVYSLEKQQLRLGVRYLGYYDTSNGSSVFISSVASVVPKLVSPNKLYYANAFPGVDIEYVYTKGRFLQNAIINSLSSYPSPEKYGLNPESTYLIVATELDLGVPSNLELTVAHQKYTGSILTAPEGSPLTISDSSTKQWLCSFEPNQAFDSAEQKKEISVRQHLVELNGKHYLVEGVPYAWFKSVSLPVTIDWELRSGGLNGNEVWRAGPTYWVSGTYTVNTGYTLIIDGGAIVKLGSVSSTNTNIRIRATNNAQILVMGSKFNYVLFTSANDTSVGEILPGTARPPQPGDYSAALVYDVGAKNNSRVNYAKFRYGNFGLRYNSTGLTVRDSIFRNCNTAIYCSSTSTTVVSNNIISQCTNGVIADNRSWVRVNQNTIDSTYYGLSAGNLGQIRYYDNLFSNINTTAYSWNTGSYPEAHHNAFYNNINNPDTTAGSIMYHNPYMWSPNGSYYLNQTEYVGGRAIDSGSTTAQAAGMNLKTTTNPSVFTTAINGYTNQWRKVSRDINQVDIGYHYDPVDVVIQPQDNCYLDVNDSGAPLSIDSGVVVSFYRTLSNNTVRMRIKSNSKMTAVGTDTEFIQFTSVYATSDAIQAPLRGGLDLYDYYGIILRYDANPDSNIQFSECNYAQYGIRVNGDLNITRPIQNNVFSKNYYGLGFNYTGNAVNNLFIENKYGILVGAYNAPTTLVCYLQSNTFYNNNTAIYITNTLSNATGRKIITRLENNILTSNYLGALSTTSTNSFIQIETRNNLFWNNQ
ncbi:MAG: NosD domain-containing protein, partial [bacterium]|nr:NosD domain-containing protein [bacterium]